MKNNKLLSLAKGKPVKKIVKEKNSPEKERELKAKQKVEELLQDVPLSNPKTVKNEEPKKVGLDWLEEEVGKLSEENEKLRADLANAKEDLLKRGGVNNDDDALQLAIIALFNRVQGNFFKIPNLVLLAKPFMNEMIDFFPFLKNEKKY